MRCAARGCRSGPARPPSSAAPHRCSSRPISTGPDARRSSPGARRSRRYDRVFRNFFGAQLATIPMPPPKPRVRVVTAGLDSGPEGEAGDRSNPAVALASRVEILRRKSFDSCTREELDEIAKLAAGFARALPRRRSRRRRAARQRPARPAAHAAPLAAHRRRAVRPPLPRAASRAAPAGSAARRVRLDGGALAGAARARAFAAAAAAAHRGLLLRDAADVGDARARRVRPGRSAPPRGRTGRRLGRRHAHRRVAEAVPRRHRPPRRGARRDRRDLLRRSRRRRPRAARASRWRGCTGSRTASSGSTR